MERSVLVSVFLMAMLAAAGVAQGSDVVLLFRNAKPGGLVAAPVDMTAALKWANAGPVVPPLMTAYVHEGGQPVQVQFLPSPRFDGGGGAEGMLFLRLPEGFQGKLNLRLDGGTATPPRTWDGTVRTDHYEVTHDAARMAGMPHPVVFPATGKRLETFIWNDRLHHREAGSFLLRADPEAEVDPRRYTTGATSTTFRWCSLPPLSGSGSPSPGTKSTSWS